MRSWDADARAAAWDQAQQAAERDPDAAAHLLDCLAADTAAAQAEADDDADLDRAPSPLTSPPTTRRKPFDPMRLVARVARYYRWSHRDIMTMPWRTFLGYVREADIMTQEEKDAMDAEMRNGRGRYGAPGSASVLPNTSALPSYG